MSPNRKPSGLRKAVAVVIAGIIGALASALIMHTVFMAFVYDIASSIHRDAVLRVHVIAMGCIGGIVSSIIASLNSIRPKPLLIIAQAVISFVVLFAAVASADFSEIMMSVMLIILPLCGSMAIGAYTVHLVGRNS